MVATFHGEVDIGLKERLKWLKMRAINLGASRIIAVSQQLYKDILKRTSLNPNKTHVIYNGINTPDFQRPKSNSLKQKYGWPDNVFLIGCLGNIRPPKGYEFLVKAGEILSKKDEKYRFVVAGQPGTSGLYEKLLKMRDEAKLQNHIIFLGFIENPAEYLSNLDLFLSTSVSEGLPLSAIQAMAAGLPLLATRCGGYEELVTDKENGWLVDVGDIESIASAIESLASNPELRLQLAGKALGHVQNTFDSKVMYKQYQNIYDSLLTL